MGILMTVTAFTPKALILTESAKEKANSLKDGDKLLRVYVHGGGCSGFQYGFSIEEASEDDTVIDNLVLVDSLSYSYVVGSILDYKEDIMGSTFQLSNPNAVGTCGCGVSFTV
jgi:iron-sulfur cluster insertion protein